MQKDSALPDFVSVIVPTYNEKGNAPLLIQAIHNELHAYPHEILLMDDNSPDGTFEAVQSLQLPYVRCFLRTQRRGLAFSIEEGVRLAKGSVIVVMDSDFNHQPRYLPFMIENLKFFDLVTGSRFLYGGSMDSRLRHLSSWVFNMLTRVLTGGQITDSLYGFWAARRHVHELVDPQKIYWGYGDYFIRLMFYLQQRRISILQFPAKNGKRLAGLGNQRMLRVLLLYSFEVIRLVWREGVRFRA